MAKLTDGQKSAILIWWIITAFLWASYLGLRMAFGGNCDRPKLIDTFEKDKYLGRWYEMYRGYDVPFEDYDCATATYVKNGPYIDVNNIEYSIEDQEWPKGNPNQVAKAHCSAFRPGLC